MTARPYLGINVAEVHGSMDQTQWNPYKNDQGQYFLSWLLFEVNLLFSAMSFPRITFLFTLWHSLNCAVIEKFSKYQK